MSNKGKIYAVYGTLKKGFGNHGVIAKAELIGKERVKGFKMYDNGWYPCCIPSTDENDEILVEKYLVNDHRMEKNLDSLEGYSEDHKESSLYLKQEITSESGEKMFIYVFNGNVGNMRLIPDGIYT